MVGGIFKEYFHKVGLKVKATCIFDATITTFVTNKDTTDP